MKLEFSGQFFGKVPVVKFHEDPSEFFMPMDRERQTDMTNLIVAFCNFANTPKIVSRFGIRIPDLFEEVGFFCVNHDLVSPCYRIRSIYLLVSLDAKCILHVCSSSGSFHFSHIWGLVMLALNASYPLKLKALTMSKDWSWLLCA